jgi:hypothetical protein
LLTATTTFHSETIHASTHAAAETPFIILHLASIISCHLVHLITSTSSFILVASPTSSSFLDPDKADEEQALRLPFSINQSIATHDFQTRDRDCLTIDLLDNLTSYQPH